MANIISKASRKFNDLGGKLRKTYREANPSKKAAVQAVVATMLVMAPELAFAQQMGGGTNFLCYIAQYFKQIVGSAALVAITLWAIEHIFKVSKIHDIVISVGVAAAVVIGASTIIANSGLTSSCVI